MRYSGCIDNKNKVDEIKCPINQLGSIFDYVKENPNKRYNIVSNFEHLNDILYKQIDFIREVAADYTVGCSNFRAMEDLIKKGYNAYFAHPIADWETFLNLVKAGVSDIWIDGSLGFQRNNIVLAKENVKIRVSPTMSINAAFSHGDNLNSFFIRPEDLHLYEGAIDIVDFCQTGKHAEETLLDIYQRGTYMANLRILIKQLNVDIDNNLLPTDFGKARLDCGQKCFIPNKTCHNCFNNAKLSKALDTALKNLN